MKINDNERSTGSIREAAIDLVCAVVQIHLRIPPPERRGVYYDSCSGLLILTTHLFNDICIKKITKDNVLEAFVLSKEQTSFVLKNAASGTCKIEDIEEVSSLKDLTYHYDIYASMAIASDVVINFNNLWIDYEAIR